ncbi:hypothetical protein [Vibrio coralliilyticus]|uniref:hypothetical protein n=1 Tax=Vibrio coralliilyticus TaxID=190893 RepID=UPI001561A324|nr:hypothetical protein [Vibrio coralliilyticus]NRF32984.1 hypothetical protein [Vibrio coralliilyticus]NRF55510.1 hypothetical protein [Vibrio coralliilyticus]
MNKNDAICLKPTGEKGAHNKRSWINEAEGKLASALILRESAQAKTVEIDALLDNETVTSAQVFNIISPRDAANKSSFLLLGYAIELLLKSGVVSLLIYAPKHLLERKVQNYGHNLIRIANELHIELSKSEKKLLNKLSSFIVNETRYPLIVDSSQEYNEKINQLMMDFSCDSLFETGVDIFDKVKLVIDSIDGTEINPKVYSKLQIDFDGYIIFRIGGYLPPTLIIKYSSQQVELKKNNLIDLKALVLRNYKSHATNMLMIDTWEKSDIYVVCEKKGLVKSQANVKQRK